MLSEPQLKQVWDGMLEAEIRSSYFAELKGRCNKHERLFLFLSLGAIVSVFVQLPASLEFLLPVVAAALGLYALFWQNPLPAIDAADLHTRWSKLALDYQELWENVSADDAVRTLNELSNRAIDIKKASASFPNEPDVIANRLLQS